MLFVPAYLYPLPGDGILRAANAQWAGKECGSYEKTKRIIGIILAAAFLILCIGVDVLAVRYSTVITRFWSGTFGTVQTETDDTQLKATDAAAELTETVAEEGIVLLKNDGLLPLKPTKENRSIALLG